MGLSSSATKPLCSCREYSWRMRLSADSLTVYRRQSRRRNPQLPPGIPCPSHSPHSFSILPMASSIREMASRARSAPIFSTRQEKLSSPVRDRMPEETAVLPWPTGVALSSTVCSPASAKRRAQRAAAIPPPTTATSQEISVSSQGYCAGVAYVLVHKGALTTFFIIVFPSFLSVCRPP